MTIEIVNGYALDTRFGTRDFVLEAGDIAEARADVIVVSANAGSLVPVGQAYEALVRGSDWQPSGWRSVLRFDRDSRFCLGDGGSERTRFAGAWVCTGRTQASRVLLIRLPGAGWFGDPVEAYGQILDATFAALALLEFCEPAVSVRHVAMTDLGGSRGFPALDRMRELSARVERWLDHSLRCARVSLVLWEPERRPGGLVDQWQAALEKHLGRVRVSLWESRAAQELRGRARAAAAAVRVEPSCGPGVALASMQQCLTRDDVSLGELGYCGRRLAEALVDDLLLRHQLVRRHDLLNNIDLLGQAHVSDWVRAYLHTLRVLGNESVHVRDKTQRLPSELEAEDALVLLASILRVLDFWRGMESGATQVQGARHSGTFDPVVLETVRGAPASPWSSPPPRPDEHLQRQR